MSEKSKPLSEETNVEELRGAIEELRWLANVLHKTLGCGCGKLEELCWNCSQADKHHNHITQVYK